MSGMALIEKFSLLTGLPVEGVQKELLRILAAANIPVEELTVDQMRAILASYLQDTLLEAKRELEQNFS